jgi:2,3-bisphosphoglycerate-dependent phosphoglycerate mutase
VKQLYFVRHAEPDYSWDDDRTRPLTETGHADCAQVTEALKDIRIDRFISSPYQRSYDTILSGALARHMVISTDERLRERKGGPKPNSWELIQKRWSDFDFEAGESLRSVQKRNTEAVLEILDAAGSETVVIGTHGTALGTILNYFDPSFGFEAFRRIIDFMPYIIRLDFNKRQCVGKEEVLIIERIFNNRWKPVK